MPYLKGNLEIKMLLTIQKLPIKVRIKGKDQLQNSPSYSKNAVTTPTPRPMFLTLPLLSHIYCFGK